MKYQYIIIGLFVFSAGFNSCKLNDNKEWDVDLLAPVANAELTVSDLIKDSAFRINPDKSLTLVQTLNLHELNVGDMIKVPDSLDENTVNLKKLVIGRRDIKRDITLGEVARNAGFAGQIILASHGNKAVIPPLSNLSSGDIEVNAENFFETATFIDGTLEIQMRNGFPIEITNVKFDLRNKTNSEIIVSDEIPSILPGNTFSKKYPLKDKTVEGKLIARIISMNSPGSNGQQVDIDTTDALGVTISVYNMQVFSAKAIFPAQNVVEDSTEIEYDLGDAEIDFMRIKTGSIVITTVHTLRERLHLRYLIPGAKKFGQTLDLQRTVTAAPINDSSRLEETIPIDGYDVDLRGKNKNTYNTFYNILTGRIDSTGQLQTLSLADKIYIYYGLKNIIPDYMHGYLGRDTFIIGPEVSTFGSFNKIVAGKISLGDLKVNLEFQNGVGAPAQIIIKSLKATNSSSNKTVTLNSGEVIGKPFNIAAALDNPFRVTTTNIALQGSEIKTLLEILPDKFEYEIEVFVNPNGNTSNHNDFVYSHSKVSANLNIELPLEIGIDGLVLQDTFPVTQQNANIGDARNVKNALLHINMENGFPLDAHFQAYILDKYDNVIDSIFNAKTHMLAGKIDPSTNKVEKPTVTKFLVEVNEAKWNKIQEGGKIIIRSTLNTAPAGQSMKIYSHYKLKIGIAAEVRYRSSI